MEQGSPREIQTPDESFKDTPTYTLDAKAFTPQDPVDGVERSPTKTHANRTKKNTDPPKKQKKFTEYTAAATNTTIKKISRYHKLPVTKVARGRFELPSKAPKASILVH